MKKSAIIEMITQRINELKYQRITLKPFITSDQEKISCINCSISELEKLARQIHKADSNSIPEAK